MSCAKTIMRALGTPGLSHAEARLYAYYVGRANGAKVCWPSIAETSADLGGMSERTIMAAHKELVKQERLRIQRRYKDTNHYFILDPDGRLYGDAAAEEPWSPPWSDLQKTAPENEPDRPESEVQECSPANPASEGLTCNTALSDLQKTAAESDSQERLKEGTSSLRSDAPVADVRDELFSEGLATLRGLTGRSEPSCRGLLGRFLKLARDDCARVLDAIRRAHDNRAADPTGFIFGILRDREQIPKPPVFRNAFAASAYDDWIAEQQCAAPLQEIAA